MKCKTSQNSCKYHACLSNDCQKKAVKDNCGDLGMGIYEQIAKSRYNLHYKIRKQGFRLDRKNKTIFVIFGQAVSKQVFKLRDTFFYKIQTVMNFNQ